MMNLLKTTGIIFLTMGLLSCNQHKNVQDYMNSGKALYQKGDYEKAKLEFKNAVQLNAKQAEAFYYLALIDEQDQYERGIFENLQQVLEINPKDNIARLKLARLLLKNVNSQGILKDLLEHLEIVLKNSPDDPSALAIKSAVLLKQRDETKANLLLAKALQKEPTNIDAVSLKTLLYLSKRDYVSALAFINKTLLLKPDEIEFYLLKLRIDSESHQPAAIIEQDYLNLTQRFPEQLKLVYALSRYYFDNHQQAKAEKLLRDTLKIHPNLLEPKLILIDYLTLLKPLEAVKTLKTYLEDSPDSGELVFRLVDIQLKNRQFSEATQLLTDFLEREPQAKIGIIAKMKLAKIALQENKDYKIALNLIEEVLAIDAHDYEALLLKARINLWQNLTDETILILRGVLENYPKSDEAMVLLAQAYQQKGDNALALGTFYKALAINPGNFFAAKPIVENYLNKSQKDFERADEIMQKVLAYHPNELFSLVLAAQVKLARSDWANADKLARLIEKHSYRGKAIAFYLDGQALDYQGQCEAAIVKYKAVLAVDPNLLDPLQAIAKCYQQLKQPKLLMEYLDGHILANPNNPNLILLKAGLLMANQNWNEAVNLLNSAITKWPKIGGFYNLLAQLYTITKDNPHLLATYQQALKAIPNDVEFQIKLAQFYEETHDYTKAKALYESILRQHPKLDVIANNLASLLLNRYNSEENIARALQLTLRFENAENPYLVDTYAWALLYSDKNVQALSLFKYAVAKMPNVAIFNYHLGVAYAKNKHNPAAIDALQQALRLGAKDTDFIEEKTAAETLLANLKAQQNKEKHH
jgi:tetratricopeptide (TPR) repeat protein